MDGKQITELSLFTGGGGGVIGTRYLLGFRTLCYVENDLTCQTIIRSRIADGALDDGDLQGDIKEFDPSRWRGKIDIVSGGFPCQPFSVAGKQGGEQDDRNLWPDTFRVIREVRPRLVFLENVPGLITSGYFGTILGDLSSVGFDAEWEVISAEQCGANHRRQRLWILAYSPGAIGDGRPSESVGGRSGPANEG